MSEKRSKVAIALGFKNFKTKKAGLAQVFKQDRQGNKELLGFAEPEIVKIGKAQKFQDIPLKLLETMEMLGSKKGENFKNPLLFLSSHSLFLTSLNEHQSPFKSHLINPLMLKNLGFFLNPNSSLLTSHYSLLRANPDLHSSKWARLNTGRGELWRLKRAGRVWWEFFKEKPP